MTLIAYPRLTTSADIRSGHRQKFASEVANEKKAEIREAILRRLREQKAELGDSVTAD
jgi:hypothetical protein